MGAKEKLHRSLKIVVGQICDKCEEEQVYKTSGWLMKARIEQLELDNVKLIPRCNLKRWNCREDTTDTIDLRFCVFLSVKWKVTTLCKQKWKLIQPGRKEL